MTERDAGTPSPKTTLVEEGTEFRGALTSKCPVVVRGVVDGEVTAPSLTVSETGGVHGTVKVTDLRSEGELAGEIDADVVVLSGTVKDATIIRARSLEVKLTAPDGKMQVLFGECRLDVGDMPSKEIEAWPAKSLAPKNASAPPPARARDVASVRPPPRIDDSAVDAALENLVGPS